ncbi:MAG: PD-(D/E)XK nuclease family protein [Thermodesulfobacteriota bacterium]
MRIVETEIGRSLESIIEAENINLDDQSIYFLLPDIPVIVQAENIFLRKNGLWGERLLTFGKLSFISNLKSNERKNVISRMGRLFLMEEIVDELKGKFSYFKKNPFIKGFSDSLLKLIAELKHARISPVDLFSISENVVSGSLKNKLRDLSLVFDQYQNKLEKEGLIDDIDKLKLLSDTALNGRLSHILPGAKKFIVFGFYDFTPSQLDVLKSIDRCGFNLTIYLSKFEGAPRLKYMFMNKIQNWFGNFKLETLHENKRTQCQIEIHSYPSIREEAEFTAREIKRLIVNEDARPGDVAIVSRIIGDKDKFLTRAFDKLGLPYSITNVGSLSTTSLGQFVLTLLRVKSSGFEKGYLLNLLRSPFLSSFFNQEDLYEVASFIDIESRKRRTLRGVKPWKEFLIVLSYFKHHNVVGRINKLIEIMDSRFNSRHIGKLTDDIARIMDELQVDKSVSKLSKYKDIHAISWDNFCNFVKELRFLSKLRFKNKRVRNLADFISLLQDLWIEDRFSYTTTKSLEKIHILTALETRGTSFPFVFVIDLGEKSFPFPFIQDPILKNDERTHINEFLGTHLLYEEHFHHEFEEFLFKLITSSANEKLYISYSHRDERERAKIPSYLVEGLKKRFDLKPIKHSIEDNFIKSENTYTNSDFAKHLFNEYRNKEFKIEDYNSYLPNYIGHVIKGIAAERERLETHGFYSEFEGIIRDTGLIPELSEISPTRLETFGDCPFSYFAKNLLRLEIPVEVEDEVNALDLGTFYHRILHNLFVALDKLSNGKIDLMRMSDEDIESALKEILRNEDLDKEFNWLSNGMRELIKKRILERMLPQFVYYEANRIREWNQKGFFPAIFEREFNSKIGEINLTGKVDRIDVRNREAFIIDYKLRPSSSKKFFDYRNLQLPLYLSAISKQELKPYGGVLRFIEKSEMEEGYTGDGRKSVAELINSAEEQLEMYVDLIKKGFFPPIIKDKKRGFEREEIELRKDNHGPCGWCEFNDLCRVQGGTFRKL